MAAHNGQKTQQGRLLGIKPLRYPSSWVIERPVYTKSLKAFVDQTNNIQKYSSSPEEEQLQAVLKGSILSLLIP